MKQLVQCGYCNNVINFHLCAETEYVLSCPACGGKLSEATPLDDRQAGILLEANEFEEWDVVEVETRRGVFIIGISPEEVRVRNREYLPMTCSLFRDRNYVKP